MKRIDTVAIILVLLGSSSVLLPALLGAREENRSLACEKRLRNLAQACVDYAHVHADRLPSNRRQPPTGWNTLVLPFVGREDLYNQYNLSEPWWKGTANRAVGATILSELICPAAPHGDRMLRLRSPDGEEFSSAATDFVASAGAYYKNNVVQRLYRGAMPQTGRFYGGSNVTAQGPLALSEITDGTSLSFLIVEMADKPNQHPSPGGGSQEPASEARELVAGSGFGQWIAPNWNHLRSYSSDGKQPFGACGVNCSNRASIFSFHQGYANVAFADGSVHRVRAGLDQEVLIALVSVADGELLSLQDYRFEEAQ